MSGIIAAFTEQQAERLTGVSRRQLQYWAHDGFFVPGLTLRDQSKSGPALYSFRDLACLKIINALRNDARLPLAYLREVKEKLAHLGDDMWAKTTLYILGKQVVFDNPYTGNKEEPTSGQHVLQIPLKVVAGDLERAVLDMKQRPAAQIGKIEKKHGGFQPVVAGTRVPVKSIQAFSEAGYSISDINKQYPSVTEKDIEAAINYKASA